jgi:hypothetical protein
LAEQDQNKPDDQSRPNTLNIRLTGDLKLDLPQAERRTGEGKDNADDGSQNLRQHKRALRKPRFIVEILALIGLWFYTTFAGYQSCQMKRATDAAKESADAAVGMNRALVLPISWKVSTIQNTDGTILKAVDVSWANVGLTPATELHGTDESIGPTKRRATFASCPTKSGEIVAPFMLPSEKLGGIAVTSFSVRGVSEAARPDQFAENQTRVFVHQCVRYKDVLSNTTWFTDLCLEVWSRDEGVPCFDPNAALRLGRINEKTGAYEYEQR